MIKPLILSCLMLFGEILFAEQMTLFQQIGMLRFLPEKQVFIEKGKVDLGNLQENEYWHVKGSFLFVPGKLLDPTTLDDASFQRISDNKSTQSIEFNLRNYPHLHKDVSSHFGTVLVKLTTPNPERLISIGITRFYHSLNLYTVTNRNATLIVTHGDINVLDAEQRIYSKTNPIIFSVSGDDSIYLVGHVRAKKESNGARINLSSLFVGFESTVQKGIGRSMYLSRAISGCFFILTIFYFFIYFFRRQDRSSLYLSLFALTSFMLSLIYCWNFGVDIGVLLLAFSVINVTGVTFLQHYLLDKLAIQFTQKTVRNLKLVSKIIGISCVFAMVTQTQWLVLLTFFLSSSSSMVMALAMIYFGFRHRMSGIVYFCIGGFISTILQYPTTINHATGRNAENGFFVLIANLAIILALALVNAKEFADTYKQSVQQGKDLEVKNREISFFNANLEKLVEQKTAEVRSLLDHIPQGVLSLITDGKIAKDYSAHLETILETDKLGGKSFFEVVLDFTDLSSDDKDQIEQAIFAIIDEPGIAYDLNQAILPKELTYSINSHEKILQLTWNAKFDKETVSSLLVTILDVTAEKKYEKEAASQQRDMKIMQELITLEATKVAQFFSTSIPLLEENLNLLKRKSERWSHSDLKHLFVNAHTVKGAARTLQFSELSTTIHESEAYYSSILRKEIHEADPVKMKTDMERCFRVMNDYVKINSDKLNRSLDFSKVALERSFIEQHYHIVKDLIHDHKLSVELVHKTLKQHNDDLMHVIFDQLPSIIDGYRERAKKIATDLGKPEPRFETELDDVLLTPERRVTLDNCMIHILRNILDHGIEGENERVDSSKPIVGTIFLQAKQVDNKLQMTVSDDGRGLAIGKLHQLGIVKGLLDENSNLRQISEFMFETGVSTAHKITDISGRGVGMNAVRSFLRQEGGDIVVNLGSSKEKTDNYYDFKLVISLPLEKSA